MLICSLRKAVSSRRNLVVIVILALSAVLIFKIKNMDKSISSEMDFSTIPLVLKGWQGKELEVTEDIYAMLETRDIMMREYKDGNGDTVILSIVYSGTNRQSFHPPEICYLGSGDIKYIENSQEEIILKDNDSIRANRLVMESPQGPMQAWYWFAAGKRFTPSYYKQQGYLALDALKGRELKGALIRVAVMGNSQDVENKTKSFIKELGYYLEEVF